MRLGIIARKGAIDFVGAYLEKLLAIAIDGAPALVVLFQPCLAAGFQKSLSAEYVGLHEKARFCDRSVNMAFRSEIHHVVRIKVVDESLDQLRVADVAAHEAHIVTRHFLRDCSCMARIGQRIKNQQFDFAVIFREKIFDEVRSYEAGAAGYEIAFHLCPWLHFPFLLSGQVPGWGLTFTFGIVFEALAV